MRDFVVPPPAPTPASHYRAESIASSGSVRHVSPEDVYDDRYAKQPQSYQQPSHYDPRASMRQNERDNQRYTTSTVYSSVPSMSSSSRQISNTSSANTAISGSENWESYASDEEEPDASDAYYAKLHAARGIPGKRFNPEDAYPPTNGNPPKKQRSVPQYAHAGHEMREAPGNRIVSGSDANWTDEDAF